MMKKINFLFIVLLVLSRIIVQDAAFGPAAATNQLNIEASVGNHAKLVLDTNIVTFSNRDPDETEQIPALETEIKVVVKARTGKTNPVILQVIADGDLSSGADTIPAQNVIWQASGKGFIGGVLSKTISQTVGFWIGSGVREGAFRYYLKNSQHYHVGNYQTTITYILTSP